MRFSMHPNCNRGGLRHGLYLGAALLALGEPALAADPVPDDAPAASPSFAVVAPRFPFRPELIGKPLEITPRPVTDGGDFLRSLPGVSGSRMGGHGIDPVIRGMQGNQINITTDNTYTFGGCPNRMDPPSAFVPVETFDLVTVSQGYRTVTQGPGGPAGHVAFERVAPSFAKDEWFRAEAGAGVQSNGLNRNGFADVTVGHEGYYLRGIVAGSNADNYDDGNGDEVRSGFRHRSADFMAGYQAPSGVELMLSGGVASTEDALFEGAMMDAPLDDLQKLRGKVVVPIRNSLFREVRAETYFSGVDHVMDNYSLRHRTAPMAMRVDSDSDTYGGTLATDLAFAGTLMTIGMDLQRNRREAQRFMGMTDTDVNTRNSIMWPGTEIRNYGLFAEGRRALTDTLRLKLGARYDRVEVSQDMADETVLATGRSPNDLYAAYYGTRGGDRSENNFGGLAFLEYDLSPAVMLTVGISRSVRTADATERSMASDSGARSWVGNPNIDPEAHHQAEIGIDVTKPDWSVSANAYADWVQNFILRDTARGQGGVLLSNGATIYRNVDALLTGLTATGQYRFGKSWLLEANATYTFGDNRSDNSPLAQIPPLEGHATLTYLGQGWSLGGTVNGAITQTRVDTDPTTGSGRDVRKTPGWVTLDLHGSVDLVDPVTVEFGVTNLLDQDYAYHLNRSNAFDPTSVQVHEPGRSFYLRLSAKF
ncbi:MAG: TonB-dependent copper receptor [Alphaproteobacteria bacterium]|nr:TonB-dependent copper receptor [Alphaproteobacteria bacterium]